MADGSIQRRRPERSIEHGHAVIMGIAGKVFDDPPMILAPAGNFVVYYVNNIIALDLFMFFFSSIKCPIWSSFFYE
jgi:hypothetical protein